MMHANVSEGIFGYFFFKFLLCQNNFSKFFAPEYHLMAQDIKTNITKDVTIWARKVQNSLLRKVAGNVGRHQTSISDNVRHYERRM